MQRLSPGDGERLSRDRTGMIGGKLPMRSSTRLKSGLGRGRPHFDSAFFCGFLKFSARFCPGFVFKRHRAAPMALAVVLPRVCAAAALAFAFIAAFATVRFRRGASPLARTLMVALPFALAGVQSATNVRFTQNRRNIPFCLFFGILSSDGDGTCGHSHEGADREFF